MTSTHRFTIRTLAVLAILASLLLSNIYLSAADGQPDALFADAAAPTGYEVPLTQDTIRLRLVRINPAQLGTAEGQGPVAGRAKFRLKLFDDAVYSAVATSIYSRAKGKLMWQGYVKGVPGSTVTLTVNKQVLAGTIHLGDQLYKVHYAGKGLHVVRQVQLSEPMPAGPPIPVDLATGSILGMDAALTDTGDTIDVMVVYTPASRARYGGTNGIISLIETAVAETNQAYANSEIYTQLNLVHTAEVNYSESGDMSTDLSRLRGTTDGYMDEVHGWRDTYKADLVSLIEESIQYCGIAYLMAPESSTFASWAFSAVASDCATGYFSFGHELGHNQGSHHDRANAGGSGAYPYSYGYWAPDYSFRTIMAYNCPGGCTRVQYFSNPDVSYGGWPTGIDHDVDPINSADNARSLNETKDTVANFRQSSTTPPAAPSNLVATTASDTQIDLTWSDNSSDETGFKIERSPDGSSWAQIDTVGANVTSYSDTGLAPSSTYYYRVRAYNAAGDSTYSNVDSATTNDPPQPPAAPSGLTATAMSDTQIDLAWTDNSDNEDGFKVERSPDGSSWSQIGTVGADVTSYSDTGLAPSTTYYYRVRAYNGVGNSAYSNVASATTDDLPSFVDQTATGEVKVAGTVSGSYADTQTNDGTAESITERESGGKPADRYTYLEHKWTFDVQAGSAVTFFANVWAPDLGDGDQFEFTYSTNDADYLPLFTVTAPGDDDIYRSVLLPPGTSGTLYVRVADTDSTQGERTKSTVWIDHIYLRTELQPGDPPAAPTGLLASAVSPSQIDLSWTDNANDEFGLYIERSLDGLNFAQIDNVGADVTSYLDTGLNPDTTYHYRVQAYNGSGSSDYSNTDSATTQPPVFMHLGGLQGAASWARPSRWDATVTITVHDANDNPLEGATVYGTWSAGASGGSECTTDGTGTCTVTENNIKSNVPSVTFSVTDVAHGSYNYDPGSNDVDTTITVGQPS